MDRLLVQVQLIIMLPPILPLAPPQEVLRLPLIEVHEPLHVVDHPRDHDALALPLLRQACGLAGNKPCVGLIIIGLVDALILIQYDDLVLDAVVLLPRREPLGLQPQPLVLEQLQARSGCCLDRVGADVMIAYAKILGLGMVK